MLPTVEYEYLKREIINKIENSTELEIVKFWFKKTINSNRSFNRVKTFGGLFDLLEIRDVLHCNDVTLLHYLGEKLKNQEIIRLVKGYEKLYLEQTCCVCGDSSFSPPSLIEEIRNSDEELYQAIYNIAQNLQLSPIGPYWRTLATQLKLPEHFVDEIRDKYPTDTFQQAQQALLAWKKYFENAATLDCLKIALEARLCKMKGLGLHLLKPVIVVE